MSEPLYAETAADLGWSPDDLDPRFDLGDLLQQSYINHAPSHVLPRKRDLPSMFEVVAEVTVDVDAGS